MGGIVRARTLLGVLAGLTLVTACVSSQTASTSASAAPVAGLPRPDHVVVVMFENHAQGEVVGSANAPYITSLASTGANFTQSFAVTHPSQPNYLALFSGSTQGITNDSCPHTFSTGNLGQQLVAAGLTFAGYSEALPSTGSTVCTSGRYARKHSPWVNFSNLATSTNKQFTAFPTDFTALPTLSFVIPDLCDDMHDCSVRTGDTWLQTHLKPYADWAATHNSVLIVDFDEDDSSSTNRIPTIFAGQPVKPGTYTERITHYSVLRTLEDLYGLSHLGNAGSAATITDVWTS
jgi:phosphatidylinositol-3-phosphatase